MSDITEEPSEDRATEEVGTDGGDGSAERPRFRLPRTWAEIRPIAPLVVFVGWIAAALLVAVARVDPWNEWPSWRRWLRADARGWELLAPGVLAAGATWMVTRAHARWASEGWSPEVVAMLLLGIAAGAGAVLWGLFALGLRPFA